MFGITPIQNPNQLMNQVDGALRYFGSDLSSIFKNFDIATVGIIVVAVILGIIVIDLFGTSFGLQPNTFYGRSLSAVSAQAWKERPNIQGRYVH